MIEDSKIKNYQVVTPTAWNIGPRDSGEVLGPIERSRTGHGDELLRSLEAYLEHNGSWEAAARALFCHRHTLRYRMSRVEELTGRRLDRVENRIEFWLALRGRELLGVAR